MKIYPYSYYRVSTRPNRLKLLLMIAYIISSCFDVTYSFYNLIKLKNVNCVEVIKISFLIKASTRSPAVKICLTKNFAKINPKAETNLSNHEYCFSGARSKFCLFRFLTLWSDVDYLKFVKNYHYFLKVWFGLKWQQFAQILNLFPLLFVLPCKISSVGRKKSENEKSVRKQLRWRKVSSGPITSN